MIMSSKFKEFEKTRELYLKRASIAEIAKIIRHDCHTVKKVIDRGKSGSKGPKVSSEEFTLALPLSQYHVSFTAMNTFPGSESRTQFSKMSPV